MKKLLYALLILVLGVVPAWGMTTTTNYGFPKPVKGESGDAWIIAWDSAQDTADAAIKTALDAKAANTMAFWTSQAEAGLTAETNIGALTTGLLKITVAAGTATPATATAGTDYMAPVSSAPADESYSGTAITGTAGENLTIGQVCYLKTDGKYWKALGDAAATMPAVAMATASISADATGTFLLCGYIRDDDGWGGALTIGSPTGRIWVQASGGTAGGITQTQPPVAADIVQDVGYAVGTRTIFFDPNRTLVTVP